MNTMFETRTKVVAARDFVADFYTFNEGDEIFISYNNAIYTHDEPELYIIPYFIKEIIMDAIIEDDKEAFNVIESLSVRITDFSVLRQQTTKELMKDEIQHIKERVLYYHDAVLKTKKNIEFFVDKHQKEQFGKYLKMYEHNLEEAREQLRNAEQDYKDMKD